MVNNEGILIDRDVEDLFIVPNRATFNSHHLSAKAKVSPLKCVIIIVSSNISRLLLCAYFIYMALLLKSGVFGSSSCLKNKSYIYFVFSNITTRFKPVMYTFLRVMSNQIVKTKMMIYVKDVIYQTNLKNMCHLHLEIGCYKVYLKASNLLYHRSRKASPCHISCQDLLWN